jgi:hypothetical protein
MTSAIPSLPKDPLEPDPNQPVGLLPDRVFYATGVLLDANDFQAEQLYHRSRLARVLTYLHGCGTAAGLKVKLKPETLTDNDLTNPSLQREVVVEPGLAIDRLGRLIEVPNERCIRLRRWYDQKSRDQKKPLVNSWHGDPINGVVLDLFLQFVIREQGRTPAFAYGPYDALSATVPSRLRDDFELFFVIRKLGDSPLLPLPLNPWAGKTTPEQRREAIYQAWSNSQVRQDDFQEVGSGSDPNVEYITGQDRTSIFLARLTLPATAPTSVGGIPQWDGKHVQVSDAGRLFVYSTSTLMQWAIAGGAG